VFVSKNTADSDVHAQVTYCEWIICEHRQQNTKADRRNFNRHYSEEKSNKAKVAFNSWSKTEVVVPGQKKQKLTRSSVECIFLPIAENLLSFIFIDIR